MSYLVLARKLRPARFQDLIGQESIWKTLLNAIKTDRIAHAFLFTGSRGVGKTSCARILTKALNCESPVAYEPCNECIHCKEISENISTDVIEIDAASNRGIEHIRELRDHVKYSPAKCKYKIYIIDEVHMLTLESFNALLKTLEEPPSHVKFILATTDPHKIPQTVISRCQRYDFVRIPIQEMVGFLQKIALSESIEVSESVLTMIAKNANGGMRDALTSFDQLISYFGKNIDGKNVPELLGFADTQQIIDLMQSIILKDVNQTMALFSTLVNKGSSYSILLTGLLELIKDLHLIKTISVDHIYWRDFLPNQLNTYQELAKDISISQLQQYFQVLLDLELQLKKSKQTKICMEMALMKMCQIESLYSVSEIIQQLQASSNKKKSL